MQPDTLIAPINCFKETSQEKEIIGIMVRQSVGLFQNYLNDLNEQNLEFDNSTFS